jgi:hypothetical protein
MSLAIPRAKAVRINNQHRAQKVAKTVWLLQPKIIKKIVLRQRPINHLR